jgi:hypothetical protein
MILAALYCASVTRGKNSSLFVGITRTLPASIGGSVDSVMVYQV